MADFLAQLIVQMAYHGVKAIKKAVKPVKIMGAGPGSLEAKLRKKLKKEGWK
jgi:hypothetical protein